VTAAETSVWHTWQAVGSPSETATAEGGSYQQLVLTLNEQALIASTESRDVVR
jgi:hypothetical protein